MSEDLRTRILEDVKAAMRARERERLDALRLITAAIKQREVDARETLDDAGVLGVLEKMLKQGRDSRAQYEAAGRDDLASREAREIEVIESYMPAPLSEAEIAAAVDAAIEAAGASSMKDMGRVMGLVRARVQGRADLGAVSALVKSRLSGG